LNDAAKLVRTGESFSSEGACNSDNCKDLQ
jgi:hypothetical protein